MKKRCIVLFTEGQTDEEFYQILIKNIRNKMPNKRFTVDAIENKCIMGIGKFEFKLLNKFKKEIIPKYPEYEVVVFLCYDTDVFEHGQHPPVDRKKLHRDLINSGATKVIHLKATSSIEDFFLQDMDGVCKFLKLKKRNIRINGKSGLNLLKYLFNCANKTYRKGYNTEGFISSLNINLISLKICGQLHQLCNELGLKCDGKKCK